MNGLVAGAVAGAMGTIALNVTTAVRFGRTDPGTWSPIDWTAHVVPHAVYGAVTTASFDHMKK
jgi:hypothetical protein